MSTSLFSSVEFRQPEVGECHLLWQIALDAKQYWGYDEAFMQSCRDELKVDPEKLQRPERFYRLGELNGKVFGFYCLEKLNASDVELDALFVSPDFIGKGLGTRLWKQLLIDVKALDAKKLVIASDPFAEPFYLKMGAKRVGDIASGSISGRVLPLMEYEL